MKTLLTLFALQIFVFVNLNAQVTQSWVARYYGLTGTDNSSNAIAVDALGNVYVTGSSGPSVGFNNYVTIKYNSAGVQQWAKTYDGSGDDYATAIVVDAQGNVYVTGYSKQGVYYFYATVKYNSSGVQKWVQYYGGGSMDDKAAAIALDGQGNIYVTGQSWGGAVTGFDYATIKYDTAGVQKWAQRYNGTGSALDNATAIFVDGLSNVYVTGYSTGIGSLTDCATIKYNTAGVQQWATRYNGPANSYDYAFSVVVDDIGNVYLAGTTYSAASLNDYLTIKYNSSGVQQWASTYNLANNSYDYGYYLGIDGAGNVYVTGQSNGCTTIKYNSSGVQQWMRNYNGLGYANDFASAIKVDYSGNAYITGYNYTLTTWEFVTIKYNTAGNQQWLKSYSSFGYSYSYAMAIDTLGNIYVTGKSGDSTGHYNYATIKYSQTVGITPISSEIPSAYSLGQNYPNPFNSTSNLKFEIAKLSDVKIVVFDVSGREVETLVNEQLQPGTYSTQWNAAAYSSGVYFYKMQAGDYFNTKKLILQK